MKFTHLRHRVDRAEALVEQRRAQTLANADALVTQWKRGWTPWRIVLAGLGLGFVIGQTRPMRAVGATNWLRAVSTVSGMFTSLQAAMAAWQADQAADKADDAADSAQSAAGATHQAAAAAGQAASPGDAQEAEQAARQSARIQAAGLATADAGQAASRSVSSYGRTAEAPGETEAWAAQAPRPAEAATDVSER